MLPKNNYKFNNTTKIGAKLLVILVFRALNTHRTNLRMH